tara:strand:- start:32 stop:163 length:132 start_codon:yes stop_codon:yes gene_type:complete
MFISRIIGRTAISILLLGLAMKTFTSCKKKKVRKDFNEDNDQE